jgi:ATP-binding cassette subfamily B protein/subfamily B ATP-binding cassette protein MsbA
LLALSRPRWGGLGVAGGMSVASLALELLKPWPLKLLVDAVLVDRPLPARASWIGDLPGAGGAAGLLAWLCAGTLLLFVLEWTSRLVQTHAQSGAGSQMSYGLAARVFEHLQALSLRSHARHTRADLVKRVTGDSACVRVFLIDVALPLVTAALTLVGVFAVMVSLDPLLALVAAGACPLFALCLRRYAGPMEARSYEQMEVQGRLLSAAEQTLTALPVVRAFGREELEDQRFAALCRQGDRAYLRTLTAQLRFKFSSGAVTAVATAVVMALGGQHVLSGQLSVGTLFVFISYLAALYGPLQTFAYSSESLASASASARRLEEILDEDDRIADGPGAVEVLPGGARIQFQQVSFAYQPGRPVLAEVSFEARPGELIAVVGPTGAGKSTLLSLLPRFHDPDGGRVLWNGIDLRRLRVAGLRGRIAVVPQDPLLFPMTVADNIRYGRPEASLAEVVAAAVAANADAFIRRLPLGYDTLVGERGATLSGGERQRLAIARALLKDAPVLILDEPTAALDAETESAVLEAIDRLMQGRTTFIIAHRFSTVRRADRILVLEDGRLVEAGTHRELEVRGGTYARLHHLQAGPAAAGGVG